MTADDLDLVVVGGGAAGLYSALTAADAGSRVGMVLRKPLSESSSFWAQGGLAAAIGDDDSPELHVEDTVAAGRGACRRSAAELLAREAPGVVTELERRGVEFDRDPDGRLSLALEGGHSRRRVVHAGGAGTGRRITERLTELTRRHERIEVREETSAVALWGDGEGCYGVITDRGPIRASATIFATGGAAALWARTTNPWGAIGAGPVMAHAAGADIADLELCQFHPTALAAPGTRFDGRLVTEAVRGEGATLLGAGGERFTDELAPRDVVTLAVLDRMERDGTDHVLLDLRAVSEARFPNIFEALREAGFDPAREPVPVSPASHYVMGGIATDLEGRSSLPGLFAVGAGVSLLAGWFSAGPGVGDPATLLAHWGYIAVFVLVALLAPVLTLIAAALAEEAQRRLDVLTASNRKLEQEIVRRQAVECWLGSICPSWGVLKPRPRVPTFSLRMPSFAFARTTAWRSSCRNRPETTCARSTPR